MIEGRTNLRGWLIRAASGTTVIKLSGLGLGYLVTILVTNMLGPFGYGSYSFALAWVTILSVPAILGFDLMLSRDIAAYRGTGQWGNIRGLLAWSNGATLAMALIVAAIAAAVASLTMLPAQLDIFQLALVLLPILALIKLRQAALRGLHHVVASQFPLLVLRPLLISAMVTVIYYWVSDSVSVLEILGVNILATAVVLLISTILLRKAHPSELGRVTADFEISNWMRSAVSLMLISSLMVVQSKIDVIMLGGLSTMEHVGMYAAALRLAELTSFALAVVNVVLTSTLSHIYATGDIKRFQNLVTISARVASLASLAVFALLSIFGTYLLQIFGTAFTQGGTALMILAGGFLVNALMGSVGLILVVTRNERWATIGFSVSILLNIILNVLLIPRWGIEGAAVATTASLVVRNVLLASAVWHLLHINSTAFRRVS